MPETAAPPVALVEPPAIEAAPSTTPEQHKGAVNSILGMLDSSAKKAPPPPQALKEAASKVPKPKEKAVEKVASSEPDTKPVVSSEPVTEPPKTEPEPVKPVVTKTEPTKEENLANLRKLVGETKAEKEAADKRAAEVEAKLAALEANRVPEEVQKELEELRTHRKSFDLRNDPQHKAKFEGPILTNMQEMIRVARDAGIPEAEAVKAVQAWDHQQFRDWAEKMDPFSANQFASLTVQVQALDRQRVEAEKGSDAAWTEAQKARETQAKTQKEQYQKQLSATKDEVFGEIFSQEGLEKREDLQTNVRKLLAGADKMPPKEIFNRLAYNEVMAVMLQEQKTVIEAFQASDTSKDEKIAQLEAFVKERGGSIPVPGEAEASPSAKDVAVEMPWEAAKRMMNGR
jgi:hypothetical protein